MWPHLDCACQPLPVLRDNALGKLALDHKIETSQMNGDRLVRMLATRMLRCISIHRELMYLREEQRIGVFRFENLRVHTPAFWTRIYVLVAGSPVALRHDQAAARTDGFIVGGDIHRHHCTSGRQKPCCRYIYSLSLIK